LIPRIVHFLPFFFFSALPVTMPKTRSKEAATKTAPSEETNAKYSLPPQTANPSIVFILPRAATSEAKIVTLPNPRYAKPTRYLVCPSTGVYEFTKISPSNSAPKSWLIESTSSEHGDDSAEKPKRIAEVIKGGDMYVAAAIDPLFLALPALVGPSTAPDAKRLFITSECHLENLPEEASHLQDILRMERVRTLFEERMGAICDEVKVGDERMFRLNEASLVQELLAKAKRLAEGSLPATMEEKFVRKALEAPVLGQRQAPISSGGPSEVSTPQTESAESQLSSITAASTNSSFASQASTVATSVADETAVEEIARAAEASAEVVALQRLRVAFNFICSSYIPPNIAEWLQEKLLDQKLTSVDFTPLDEYLAHLAKVRAEAVAARPMDFSRKHDRDEEEDEARLEKKRKMEDDKKKKSQESKALRDLKKVNTSGMKKLSDFFKKK